MSPATTAGSWPRLREGGQPFVARRVRRSGKLRVADLAEYNPQYDRDHLGARVAARLAWRLLR